MTDVETAPATAADGLSRAGRRRVLAVLCLTQISSWGILYYAFPVLSVSITRETGWSAPVITAAFSFGQLATALTGIPVGTFIDRAGPRRVMTAGSVLGVAALVAIASAPNLAVFYLGWLAAGVAMGAVLYPPAFAALTRWWGGQRVTALMILTLAGGLASTVFAPLTAALDSSIEWRGTYLILAAVLAVLTIPAHWFGLRVLWPDPPAATVAAHADHSQIARSPRFAALVVTMCLAAFASFAGIFNLVALLQEQGFSPGLAATALGLGGAGQVLGRIGYLPLARYTGVTARTVVVLAALAASTALLGVVSAVIVLIAVAIGAGLVRGVFTLIQATAITDRWGATHYGRLNGLLSAPVVVVSALAPWAGTVLSAWTGSYAHTYLILGAVAALAAVIAPLTRIRVSKKEML
ncbi:MFS transporter [Nocardia carnea]|uniref:MFS transporter n=1 Tax=Nocardia TaxID=1817 RepID=UPI003085C44C|nr:MFS transporter [Nocardia cyriacigeorgica]